MVDAEGRQFTFNGDNKQTEVKDASNNVIGEYLYDGEGKRIKKIVGGDTTVFVYSAGKLIAEYSTETPPANPTTSWTVTDQLGSPRVIVNALGEVVSRRDFMPFGEEIARSGYGSDTVRKQFTGYERDGETDLDYAVARQYSYQSGRFSTPDPALGSFIPENPQSMNRYSYVVNNPVKFIDPLGLYICTGSADQCDQVKIAIDAARANLDAIKEKHGKDSKHYKEAKRSLDAFGDHGVDNKVLVNVASVGGGAEVDRRRDKNGNVLLTIDPTEFAKDAASLQQDQSKLNSFQALMGHEGSHVEQRQSNKSGKMSIYDKEYDAHFVQSVLLEAVTPVGCPSSGGNCSLNQHTIRGQVIWDPIWNAGPSLDPGARPGMISVREDKRTAAIDALLAVPKPAGNYGVSKACPNGLSPCR